MPRDYTVGFFDDASTTEAIDALTNSTEPLTIFAGAGVPADQSLPAWGDLVRELLIDGLAAAGPTRLASAAMADRLRDAFQNLPSVSIVDELLKDKQPPGLSDARYQTRRNQRLRRMLYRSHAAVVRPSLAEYILRVAIAAFAAGRDVAILTTNYDDVLELVAEEPDIQRLAASAGVTGFPSFGYVEPDPVDRSTIPIVHLHGLLPRPKSPLRASQLVFSERDYHRWDQSPLKIYWHNRVSVGQLRFFGTSLRDINITATLEQGQTGRQRFALMPIMGDPLAESLSHTNEAHNYLALRGRHLRVDILRPNLYSQVHQFCHELTLRLLRTTQLDAYSIRLSSWWQDWSQSGALETDQRLTAGATLSGIRDLLMPLVPGASYGKVEVWARCNPDSRMLERWASSQAALLSGPNARPHRGAIVEPGHYAAVDAFASRRPPVGAWLPEQPSRWTDYIAVPVVLADRPHLGLPVGVAVAVFDVRASGVKRTPRGQLQALVTQLDQIAEVLHTVGEDLLGA